MATLQATTINGDLSASNGKVFDSGSSFTFLRIYHATPMHPKIFTALIVLILVFLLSLIFCYFFFDHDFLLKVFLIFPFIFYIDLNLNIIDLYLCSFLT